MSEVNRPPPLRPLKCGNPDCAIARGGRCARAAEHPQPELTCPDLAREDPAAAPPPSPSTQAMSPGATVDPGTPAPWSGRHLDPGGLYDLMQHTPARLIGVLGPYNAGKTTLLTSIFLQVASDRRNHEFPYHFASSRTLHSWRQLIDRARAWSGKPTDEIVAHTPTAEEAGFLHLGLRPTSRSDDRHIDVLLSDLAGEWITDWAVRAQELSRQRLAFLRRCDGFVVLADSAELMGQKAGQMDATLAAILRRLGDLPPPATAHQRGLALVFSKFDLVVEQVSPPAADQRRQQIAWGALGRRAPRLFRAVEMTSSAGNATDVFAVSAFPRPLAQAQPIEVLAPLRFLMEHADARPRWPRPAYPVTRGSSSFLALRRPQETP